MRRSASRRSRTLLLKARPPAMGTPPDPDCQPRRPALRAIAPSLEAARGQRPHRAHRAVRFDLAFGGHELAAPREAAHHEGVPRGVEAPGPEYVQDAEAAAEAG